MAWVCTWLDLGGILRGATSLAASSGGVAQRLHASVSGHFRGSSAVGFSPKRTSCDLAICASEANFSHFTNFLQAAEAPALRSEKCFGKPDPEMGYRRIQILLITFDTFCPSLGYYEPI